MKPRLLLAEDVDEVRMSYARSLELAGFEVSAVDDGYEICRLLRGQKFDVILSDSEMPLLNGYIACARALEEKTLDETTLIVGMSDDSDNQQYWRGLAHLGCFYDKDYFPADKIGEKIMQCLRNFRSGGLWATKMPCIEW